MQIGLPGLLTLLFVTMKLLGVIAWSWWLVLLPAYGSAILFLLFLLFVAWANS